MKRWAGLLALFLEATITVPAAKQPSDLERRHASRHALKKVKPPHARWALVIQPQNLWTLP